MVGKVLDLNRLTLKYSFFLFFYLNWLNNYIRKPAVIVKVSSAEKGINLSNNGSKKWSELVSTIKCISTFDLTQNLSQAIHALISCP